jgi:CO/xanthine dehydrogenase FAD-binding subunit
LRIGALVTAEQLASSRLVRRDAPVLAQAAAATSAPALRRRGTVGGNIVTPHPAGDVTTALLALAATVELVDGDGVRETALAELSAPDSREQIGRRIILAVTLRKCRASAFEKFGSRTGFSRSVVAVATALHADGVGLALGAMNDRPFAASRTAEAIEHGGAAVAAALADECRPPHDGLASNAYRLKLAETLIGRALARSGKS